MKLADFWTCVKCHHLVPHGNFHHCPSTWAIPSNVQAGPRLGTGPTLLDRLCRALADADGRTNDEPYGAYLQLARAAIDEVGDWLDDEWILHVGLFGDTHPGRDALRAVAAAPNTISASTDGDRKPALSKLNPLLDMASTDE